MSSAKASIFHHNREYTTKLLKLNTRLLEWLHTQPFLTEDMVTRVEYLKGEFVDADHYWHMYEERIPLYRRTQSLLSEIIVSQQDGDFASDVFKLFEELFDNGLFSILEVMIGNFLFRLSKHVPVEHDEHEDEHEDIQYDEDDDERS